MGDQIEESDALVTEFIAGKGAGLHEAFSFHSSFNRVSSQYEAKSESRQVTKTQQLC
jgi:hypothetical protein